MISAGATTSSMKKSTKEVPKMKRTENDRRSEQNHDEEVLMEIAQITLEQARIALTHFGSLEATLFDLLKRRQKYTHRSGGFSTQRNIFLLKYIFIN